MKKQSPARKKNEWIELPGWDPLTIPLEVGEQYELGLVAVKRAYNGWEI